MKMTTKLSLVGVIATAVILTLMVQSMLYLEIPKPDEFKGFSGKIDTYYCTEFKHAGSDKWEDLGCKHNVFTNAGKYFVEGLLNGTINNGAVLYLALGNGSEPVATSTTLNNEQTLFGLARVLGTSYGLGLGWWEVNTTFTFTGSNSLKVNTTASFNQSSAGTMLAAGIITDVTFTTNGDQLRLRHNNTIS